MADRGPAGEGAGPDFSLKRFSQFVRDILDVQRSIRELREANAKLKAQVDELQRVVDDHNGQLKVISSTVLNNMDARTEATAQRAAIDAVVKLLGKPEDS